MTDEASYEIVVGLEVHAQLLTRTKLFCSDTTLSGAEPNTQISAISLGYPGTLPRLNREAILLAVRLGLATNCTIVRQNYFARKNYFYPDLPKGYQISQHTTPICRAGFLEIQAGDTTRNIRINRIHMEEDAGKSLHGENSGLSSLDYNRAGMPLLEIVTEPDMHSAEEAFAYVTTLRKLVRHLGVCDGNMEQGSLRCDVNISVRLRGEEKLGTKVEIKNLNSIRFIKKAIEWERERLIDRHRKGLPIVQETRGFDETDFTTYSIRVKEDEDDYRYFAEPDLPPFVVTEETIERVRSEMPPLPGETKKKLLEDYGLSEYDAEQVAGDMELTLLFFDLAALTNNYKAGANWIIGPIKNSFQNSEDEVSIEPVSIAHLIRLIDEGRISHGTAVQKVFPALLQSPAMDVEGFIGEQQLFMQSDAGEIESWIDAALEKHAQKINEYKKGKKGLISLFVGEVMKRSGGQADARLVTQKLIEKLNN
jgi:aspartyl-tRNA(Asn)/glutamyl-tRNA(Gln) amidotransferase subunit B